VTPAPRSAHQRKADVLALFGDPGLCGTLTSVDGDADPEAPSVPLAWVEEYLVLAAAATDPVPKRVAAATRVRLDFGSGEDDVVRVDAEPVLDVPAADAHRRLAEGFVAATGWDPRAERKKHRFVVLEPRRIQAWRGRREIAGRTVMMVGAWKV